MQLASSEHFLYFPLAAIHVENLFFKIKQKIFLKDDVILIEDYLIFNYEFTTQVEKHLVIETVWEVHFTDEEFDIDLNQEL